MSILHFLCVIASAEHVTMSFDSDQTGNVYFRFPGVNTIDTTGTLYMEVTYMLTKGIQMDGVLDLTPC